MNFSQLNVWDGNLRWVFQRALFLFFIPGLLVLIFTYYLYITERETNLHALALREQRSVGVSKTIINMELTSAKTRLQVIRAQSERMLYAPQHDTLLNRSDQSFTSLAGHFIDLITLEQKYDQVRLLDNTGREMIRVNFKDDRVVLVPEHQLQNKSGRYYFKNTMALEAGATYVSPLDLNVEQGKIELPVKPMLRLGARIDDSTGSTRGIILLNFLGETLFDNVNKFANTDLGRLMIVNADGYWIHNQTTEREWGFMLGHKENRFQIDFPDAWLQISINDTDQLLTPAGLFTFASIYPNLDFDKEGKDLHGPESAIRTPSLDQFWKIISIVPQSQLDKINAELVLRWTLVGAVMLSLLALLSFFIAQMQSVRREVDKRISRLETQESLGQLANSVAHEFNNLLLPIYALSKLVMDGEPKESSAHRRLEKVVEASQRAKKLLEGVLVFGKESPDANPSCDAKTSIENALVLVRDTLPSTIRLDEDYASGVPPIAFSTKQLQIIFVNLMSNAREALEGRTGTITITLRETHTSSAESKALGLSRNVKYAHLSVSDTGCGMNEETLRQALNPLFTTKTVGEGQGLGLYQVNLMANITGGALLIESVPNIGTNATVWLPIFVAPID